MATSSGSVGEFLRRGPRPGRSKNTGTFPFGDEVCFFHAGVFQEVDWPKPMIPDALVSIVRMS